MAWIRKRIGTDGRPRYQACYRNVRDQIATAGTFTSKKDAEKAGHEAEVLLRQGRLGAAQIGRRPFSFYVNEIWFPNHVLEPSTREGYRYTIDKHLMPTFGPMKMTNILPSHVREWVTERVEAGVSPASIRHNKIVLSAIFTTALNDQVTQLHPCKGVKTPTVARKAFRIVTPAQFQLIYDALPDEDNRLLVETAISSGLRWGELTELRPGDLDPASRILTVSRAVVQLDPKFHPEGLRFHVKPYPKNRLSRRFKLDPDLCARLAACAEDKGLGPDDLLFQQPGAEPPRLRIVPDAGAEPGLTDANDKGRSYRHGTLSAYTAGKCRCGLCRDGFADYRARRRATGVDRAGEPRRPDTDGHLGRDWFTRQVWKPALATAGLTFTVRMHDLRHAHASWLLAGGADLQVVKERLGHASIATTELYLHTLPDADDTALDALSKIRKGS